MRSVYCCTLGLFWALTDLSQAKEPILTSQALVAAVQSAQEGDTIELGAGRFELDAPLELKTRTTLKGAGPGKTILTHAAKWKPSTKALPDPEMRVEGLDTDAYLIRLVRGNIDVTISDMTLLGPQLHGAIFSQFSTGLTLHHLRIEDFLWSGIRTFSMRKAKIHDCEFLDAGGRWSKGEPGVQGGITGGGIFAIWMAESEIWNNRFTQQNTAKERRYFGIKVRQAKRCRVHHNTIHANFSMEFPFENDEDNELDYNVCHGVISIPKHAGGPIPKSGKTFHIHHNYFTDSYSIEFVRNGVEIDHNLFDFDPKADHGNLISGFGNAAANGPASFHNNLVNNPGRGVIWINPVFNNLKIHNNHIISRTTTTLRKDGLFGFNPKCDFKTITIQDNIIECQGTPRPLVRNSESYGAVIQNNKFTNVADASQLKNPKADRVVGPEQPLKFECGVQGEFTVDGWTIRPSKK